MFKRSFKNFVEQELGSFPKFLIYTVLEWILITTLFIDGVLAFLSNQYARFFDLNAPCLLCTRIDHVLIPRDPHFYYNESICDSHKKKVSSLAYCHVHKKLSEIKHMCEGCLLSFATEKESDCDTYKSLIGILHKDLELLIDDERDLPLGLKKGDNLVQTTTHLIDSKTDSSKQHCSCCGELLKTKTEKFLKKNNSFLAPAPSPRVSYNKVAENESEFKDFDVEERTPSFVRGGNKFFGIPLSDSAQNSPRWSVRSHKKPSLDKLDVTDLNSESILNQLKKEVRLDKKSLIDLYMELDEERNASAVAANNAMAMITKLQAEKAAVQMEALQYQRMMDEQAEYDQEALQSMSSDLAKKEEEFKELEAELEAYRERYGCLTDDEDSREEFLDDYGNARADDDASREEFLEEQGNARADNDGQETKVVSEFEDCSSNHEEDAENTDQTRSCKSEESGGLVQMKSSDESTAVNGASAEKEKGSVSKEGMVNELSAITERLSALQSDGELLKYIADAIDVSEGEAMLLQISQNLHMLRSFVAMPSES
ncbi:myosin-binding protein 6 [Hirschfeldia incana]|nr:myosin-binding protein 6 [Hirschfeldia incana]